MLYQDESHISPFWAGFKSIWTAIAIALLLSLALLWLLGYGPGGACGAKASVAKVADVTAPKVTLNSFASSGIAGTSGDSSIVRIPVGSSFSDVGATAVDNVDGDITVKVTGDVDTTTPGEYQLTYTATDAIGNTSSQIRTVIVEAAPAPAKTTLTLKGDADVSIPVGEAYIDAGAIAHNDTDGDITVEVTGEVDSNTPGEYMLTYTATDSAGNTETAIRNVFVSAVSVEDVLAPSIKLKGSNLIKIPLGMEYVEQGFNTSDNSAGEVKVEVKGAVDTNTPGSYELTYLATDANGNTATTTRTIIIEDSSPKSADIPASARLYFGFDKFTPANDRDNTLSGVLQYLQANPSSKALISGFHDPSGNITYNHTLAKQRAKAVSSLLQKNGISEDRIVLQKPTETTGTGLPAEARRVEVTVGDGSEMEIQ
ncbi:MAG: immunoglobulin-like domain-containing protein [Thiotrichaceae bacterium]